MSEQVKPNNTKNNVQARATIKPSKQFTEKDISTLKSLLLDLILSKPRTK